MAKKTISVEIAADDVAVLQRKLEDENTRIRAHNERIAAQRKLAELDGQKVDAFKPIEEKTLEGLVQEHVTSLVKQSVQEIMARENERLRQAQATSGLTPTEMVEAIEKAAAAKVKGAGK